MRVTQGQLQKCEDKQAWDDYVLDNEGHPFQLWGWGEVKSMHGWRADRYFLLEDLPENAPANIQPTVVAGVQVLTRKLPYPFRAFSYIPRGPIGTNNPSEQARLLNLIADTVKENYRSIGLSVEPDYQTFNIPHDWQKGSHSILQARTVQLDLQMSESDLLANMAKKTRQYIRKSAAENIEIRQVKTVAELNHVLDVYRQTANRAKFQIHSDQYYHDIFTQMADNNVIYASYLEDKPIAFLWLALTTETAYELYGGMTEQGAELRANYALKWHAIRRCKEWDINTYDFGGIIEGGVLTFKHGWTNQETELAGTFDKSLSPLYKTWTGALPAAKKVTRSIRKAVKR